MSSTEIMHKIKCIKIYYVDGVVEVIMIKDDGKVERDILLMNKYKNYYGHPMFYEILENLAKLHSEKNKQYATKDNPLGNFTRGARLCDKLFNPKIKNKALAMALCYMAKQVDGIYEIVGEGKEGTVDSLKDKLSDIAVYSIICMILVEEYKEKEIP